MANALTLAAALTERARALGLEGAAAADFVRDALREIAAALPVSCTGDTITLGPARIVLDVQRRVDVGAHVQRLLTRQEGEP